MKLLSAILMSTLLGAAAASAADAPHESPREKAVMFYFSKSFGGDSQARTPLAFGLRLQQSSPIDTSYSVALIDARYWLGGPRMLALGGVPALSLGGEDDGGSSADSSGAISGFASRHPGWTIGAIVIAVLGGACLAEWGICENDDGRPSDYDPPGSTPGTG